MAFKFTETKIKDVIFIQSDVYKDDRGFFREVYKMPEFLMNGLPTEYRQENTSFSRKGTIRGLHYQVSPFQQGKLISCLKGKVIDFAVDLRHNSDTFLNYVEVELSEDNGNLLYISKFCAHGFLALEDSVLLYKATNLYSPEHERCIRYDDPYIGIHFEKFGITDFIVSEKDKSAPLQKYSEVF